MDAYLTPDNPPGSLTVCRGVCLPADSEYLALLGGAISSLIDPDNYEAFGDETPEDTAAFFMTVFDKFYESTMYVSLGMIMPFATDSLPAWVLPCDGSQYDRVDYPALYAVLDSNLIIDADTFETPDLAEKYIAGAGGGLSALDTVGSNTVGLTVAEMPAHTHTYTPPVANVDLESPGAPDIFAAGVGLPVQTGSTGSGDNHENRPETLALKYGMVAYG